MSHNFRTAFNGFHKEDVVRYLEYINNKHQNQVNQLNTELEELRAQQPKGDVSDATIWQLRADNGALQAENQELRAQNQALESRCAELAAQLEKAQAAQLENAQAAPEDNRQELDAYRQAERIQKEAQEQVELLYFQANHILTQANARLDHAAEDLTQLTDEVMGQITQLQMAVTTGKQTLQDASSILSTIRPNR